MRLAVTAARSLGTLYAVAHSDQVGILSICQVDWLGQKAQIDAAQKAGVQKVCNKLAQRHTRCVFLPAPRTLSTSHEAACHHR